MQQKFDPQKLMELARSPAGQKLMETLKLSGGTDVEAAASYAQKGNLEQAKKALSALAANPEIQALLHQLEGQL